VKGKTEMSAVDTEENDGRSGNDTSNTWQAFHRKTKGSDVPGRFVTPGSDMSEAITATRIVNENQLNNILRLDAKLERFHVTQGQQTLLKKVNGMRAIGGYSVAGMLQAHTQILVPEGLGVDTSKKSKKEMQEIKKHRERRDVLDKEDDDRD